MHVRDSHLVHLTLSFNVHISEADYGYLSIIKESLVNDSKLFF